MSPGEEHGSEAIFIVVSIKGVKGVNEDQVSSKRPLLILVHVSLGGLIPHHELLRHLGR